MTDAVQHHCTRSWWMRPPVWFIGIAALALGVFVIVETLGGPVAVPYSTFLDQLDAGNVASVTFEGAEIEGRFKQPLTAAPSAGATGETKFFSRVPDVGDVSLIPKLREQNVMIDVVSSSQWTAWLGGLPLPMLIFLGVIVVGGLVRLVRGGKARSASPMSMHPMGGMMGIVSGLFGKQQQATSPPADDSGEPKGSKM